MDQFLGPIDDGNDGPPGRRDPPSLDELDRYRNADTFEVTGLIAPDDTAIVVKANGGGLNESFTATIDGGTFAAMVTIPRGQDIALTAVNDNGTSTEKVTMACDPWDAWELDSTYNGDVCDEPIVISQSLYDAEDIEIVIGNVLVADDEDWYFVHTVDEAVIENSAGYENYHFVAELKGDGAAAYAITVHKGSCGAAECPEAGAYQTYEWFTTDTEPDELGNTPADPRSCGEPPLNPCEDWSESYWIQVKRIDGKSDCTHYELELSNGLW
jgi:hypothetical protein